MRRLQRPVPPEDMDPRVRAEIRRSRSGEPRYVFIVTGSNIEHRDYPAALLEITRTHRVGDDAKEKHHAPV